MNKNNLIRFAQSLVFLPFVVGTTVPLGNILKDQTRGTFQIVFIQKKNIEANSILAFNQALYQKAEEQKVKAKAIDDYFKLYNMPLFGVGMKMVKEAEKNNIDWRLLPAIAVRESTGGKYGCKKVKNNSFGWGSCKISFSSKAEAIETVAKNLGGNNPNTAKHYANKSLKEILHSYNPPSIIPRYSQQVISIMNAMGKKDLVIDINV